MKWLLSLLFSAFTCISAQAGVNCTLPVILQNNTLADANQVMADFNAVIACLANAAISGQNNDITALNALVTPLFPSQGGTPVFLGGRATGSVNDISVPVLTPSGFTQTSQYVVVFYANASNSGEMSLNVNSTGQTAFYRQSPSGPQKMTGGEVIAGQLVVAAYNNTVGTPPIAHPTWNPGWFECLSCGGIQYGGFGPQQILTAATSTDLGLSGSHNVVVSGSTTITNFGMSASQTFPMYFVGFSGVSTLKYNNTACATVGGCIVNPGGADIVTSPGDTAWLLYLGPGSNTSPAQLGNWQVLFYQKATGQAVVNPTPNCGFNGLTWANGASTTNVTVNWRSASLVNPLTQSAIYSGPLGPLTLDTTSGHGTSTPGGMDGTAPGANSFVYMYGISNGNSPPNVLGSTSPTTPNLPPAGPGGTPPAYQYYCYLGAIKMSNTVGSLYGMVGKGNHAQYVAGGPNMPTMPVPSLPILAAPVPTPGAGPCGTALVGVTVIGANGWVPSNASEIVISMANTYNMAGPALVAVSPNNAIMEAVDLIGASNSGAHAFKMVLESNSIYWCSTNAGGVLFAFGYTDSANAN